MSIFKKQKQTGTSRRKDRALKKADESLRDKLSPEDVELLTGKNRDLAYLERHPDDEMTSEFLGLKAADIRQGLLNSINNLLTQPQTRETKQEIRRLKDRFAELERRMSGKER